jgi:parallel beta-helix repeat protein
MAKINDGTLKDWKDGDKVTSDLYEADREILRVANNDNHDRIVTLEVDKPIQDKRLDDLEYNVTGTVVPMTFKELGMQNLTFDDIKLGYVDQAIAKAWKPSLDTLTRGIVEETTATDGQTVVNLTNSYTVGGNQITVEIDGVPQDDTSYTETSTTSITLTEALVAGQRVVVTIGKVDPNADARFSSLTTQLADSAKLVVNLESFKRQGSETDDNARISRAITSLSGKAGKIQFGYGVNYTITSTIVLTGLSNLVLDGNSSTIKVGGTSEILTFRIDGCSKIEIKGFNFDGSNATIASNASPAIRSATIYCGSTCDKINIHDNYFLNGTGGGIQLNKPSNTKVYNNYFENGKYHAIGMYTNVNNVQVLNNYIVNYLNEGIKLNGSAGAGVENIVSGNFIQNLTKEGSNFAIGIEIDHGITKTIVSNNIIDNCADMGISIDSNYETQVVNNRVVNINTAGGYGTGIELAGSDHCTVVGNVVENCLLNCIYLDKASDNIVKGNILKGDVKTDYTNENHGIFIQGISTLVSNRNIVTDNIIEGFTYGIYQKGYSHNNTIKGNRFTNGFTCIILVGDLVTLTHNNIIDNKFENFSNACIRFSNVSYLKISGNHMTGKNNATGSGVTIDQNANNIKIMITDNFVSLVWSCINISNAAGGTLDKSLIINNMFMDCTNDILNPAVPTNTTINNYRIA